MATEAHSEPVRDPRYLRPIPRFIFASRWLQLPLYLGLIVAQVVGGDALESGGIDRRAGGRRGQQCEQQAGSEAHLCPIGGRPGRPPG